MFTHTLDPVLIHLGPFDIRYYGIFYVIGFLFALWWLKKFAHKLTKDDSYDLLLYLMIGGVGGGRLGYIIFYNLPYYLSNPLKILAVWEGGMSIHGGLIGAIIATLLFCNKLKKQGRSVSFFYIADTLMVPLAIALALGRIGNFINGELYGYITNFPWCVKFQGAEGCRHPSQLYESAKNLLIALSLYLLSKKENLKEGTLFWTFLVLYGILRFLIEFVRYNDSFYFGLTMGQLLSSIMIIVGGAMLYKLYGSKP